MSIWSRCATRPLTVTSTTATWCDSDQTHRKALLVLNVSNNLAITRNGPFQGQPGERSRRRELHDLSLSQNDIAGTQGMSRHRSLVPFSTHESLGNIVPGIYRIDCCWLDSSGTMVLPAEHALPSRLPRRLKNRQVLLTQPAPIYT